MEQKRIRQNKKFLERFQGKSNIVTKQGIIKTIDRQLLIKKINLNNPERNQESLGKDKTKTQKAETKKLNKLSRNFQIQLSELTKAIKNKRAIHQLVLNRRSNSRDQNYFMRNYSESHAYIKNQELLTPKSNTPKMSKAYSHTDLRKNTKTICLPTIKLQMPRTGRGDDLLRRLMSMDKHAISHFDLLNKIEERFKKEKVKSTNRPLFCQLFTPR